MCYGYYNDCNGVKILIESQWNLNSDTQETGQKVHQILIESQWNLN